MKIFKGLKKLIIGGLVTTVLSTIALPFGVSASSEDNYGLGTIDMNKDATLSVYYYFDSHGDIPEYGKMAGVKAKAYRIATVSETGEFSLIAPFDALEAEISDMNSISDQDKWNSIITDATKIVVENNIEPDYTATSESDGYAKFGTVEKGLYLGINEPLVIDEIQYKYWDFLSVVPGPNNLEKDQGEGWGGIWDGTWSNAIYDVVAVPKREAIKLEGDPEEFQVFKQWVDDGASARPNAITVNIYRDGALAETVSLSDENNWQYKWKSEKGHNFTVEEVLDSGDYTSKISREENKFVIVNTKNPETPEKPEKPHKPGKPKKPSNPGSPDNPETPDTPSDDTPGETPDILGAVRKAVEELPAVLGARRLPQTGQLWWPIPVLAILGIVLIFLGFRSEKKRK